MEWTDEGIVLGTRRHGEANAILEVMTREHGRHLGLVRGGSASRLRPVLQPGNVVRAVWRARLDEHLGHYTVEPLQLHAASLLAASHVVYGVTHLAALCRLLPERDPHPEVHEWLSAALARLDDPLAAGAEVVRFELRMLAELGFGLDLSSCAATGGEIRPRRVAWRRRAVARPAVAASFVRDGSARTGGAIRDRPCRWLCADRLFPSSIRAGAAWAHLCGCARRFRRRGARPPRTVSRRAADVVTPHAAARERHALALLLAALRSRRSRP
jgi:recombinational DNA repair protein (RecF pathway)